MKSLGFRPLVDAEELLDDELLELSVVALALYIVLGLLIIMALFSCGPG
jgi:hypothetical protein